MHKDMTFNRPKLEKSLGVIMNFKGSSTNRLMVHDKHQFISFWMGAGWACAPMNVNSLATTSKLNAIPTDATKQPYLTGKGR